MGLSGALFYLPTALRVQLKFTGKPMTTGLNLTPSPPAKRGRRLATITNVRCALADVLRALENDQINPTKGRVLIYGFSVLASLIEGSDLEARITELEGQRDLGRPT